MRLSGISGGGAPLYLLVDEKSQETLVAAEDIAGFFVNLEGESPEVAFLGVHELDNRRTRVEDAVLKVVNRYHEKIGEYYIGRAVRGSTGAELVGGVISSVSYPSFGDRCEFPGASEIWQRWASDVALKVGEWLRWPVAYHDDWLHVVQNSWFARNRRAGRYGSDEVLHLDGSKTLSKSALYCALGEAVNGPGGYFGSNLDALADCLSLNFGKGRLTRIVWQNFYVTQSQLGNSFPDSVVGLLREFDIEVLAC